MTKAQIIFSIIYWTIGIVIIFGVYFLFKFLNKKLIEWGKNTARAYLDKIDPDEEELEKEDSGKNSFILLLVFLMEI